MTKITDNTPLQQVISEIGWEEISYMVDPLENVPGFERVLGKPFAQLPLSVLPMAISCWNMKSVIAGLEFLRERCSAGQVFYRFNDHPRTGLAAFPLKKKSKCVIICPGGGYTNVCSLGEGYPLAAKLHSMGCAVFVVQYRTAENAAAPNPMNDLADAVRFIFAHADEWNLDMEDYAVMGFSAGGHLAASFGTESLGYAHYGLPRPGCMMLGYPVVTMGEYTHAGSRENLLGKDSTEVRQDAFSIEKQAGSTYPKTFLWQCREDGSVPVENSRLLYDTLTRSGVPCKYELFPGSAHGWGLAEETVAEGWLERAITFWKE